jgi:branched-chain amino acid transport system substrate-binding protein
VLRNAAEQGPIDLPIEIIYRKVEVLPKGSDRAVIDALGELVDEVCLAIFGPSIAEYWIPTSEAVVERFKVPLTSARDAMLRWTSGSSRSR